MARAYPRVGRNSGSLGSDWPSKDRISATKSCKSGNDTRLVDDTGTAAADDHLTGYAVVFRPHTSAPVPAVPLKVPRLVTIEEAGSETSKLTSSLVRVDSNHHRGAT